MTAYRDDLGQDRECDLLDAARTDIQPDRCMHSSDVPIRHTLRSQPRDPFLVRRAAADRPDIPRWALEGREEGGVIELVVMREDGDRGCRPEAQLRQRFVGPGAEYLDVWEALRVGERSTTNATE